MRKIFSILFALVLAVGFVLATAVPAGANGVVPDRVTAITNAADRLVETQSTATLGLLAPPDYGWDWEITGLTQHSATNSAHNMYGVVILGLLDAYEETDNASYLAAATAMADHMTSGDASEGDFYKQGGEQESAGSYDYQFLMRYAEVSGDSDYSDYAIALWAWDKANTPMYASPEDLNDALLEWAGSDPGAASWMLAAYGMAILAMGDDTFATGCADLIVDKLDSLEGDHMALAECLEFLSELDSTTYSATIDNIITALVDTQQADGCWDDGYAGTFQDTAYPVRALAVYGGTEGLNAARKGAAWLVDNQLGNGGWIDDSGGSSDEYSEQDAEGLRALVATEAPVTIVENGKGYYSIQAAIDAASPGDTIEVAAGTYVEVGQIVINKDLTIIGEDKETTIIKPAQNIVDWFLIQADVEFHLSDVTLDGAGHDIRVAIRTHGSGSITNTVIENIRYAKYLGWGIALTWSTSGQNWTISGNEFRNIERVGMLVDGQGNKANVSANTIVGNGDGDWVGYGVEVGDGAYAAIADNSISGYRGVASSDGSVSGGILVTSYFGPNPEAFITGNDMQDNSYAILVGYWDDDTSKVVANFNNIAGNDYGVDAIATMPTPVDARYNWWGDASGPYHATTNSLATGDSVSDNVDYSPWWGANYIGVAHPWSWYTNDSIQDAIDAASAGDTINVVAGTYTGFEVTKDDLTIQGPTDAVVSGAAPTRDAVVYIGNGASSVTIQGLTINAAGVEHGIQATESGTYSNIAILGSTIKDFKKSGIVVNYASAVQLEGNIIDTTDHSEAPNGIQIGASNTGTTGTVKGNQISGCHWEGYDPETETYEGDWTGSGILVIDDNSALEISNNEVQGCDVGMDIESGTPTTITGNVVHDNSYGFVLWNAAPTINYNNIYQNVLYGVYRAADGDPTGTVDATYNWWGDASGPYDPDGTVEVPPCTADPTTEKNADGTGDKVSDSVDYCPWSEAEFPTVTTQAATSITTNSANLNMSYTMGNYGSVQVCFAYKKFTDSTWTNTIWVPKTADGTHAEPLIGLASGTQYDFQAQLKYDDIVYGERTIEGDTLQFTTLSVPTVATQAATDVNMFHATLNMDYTVGDYSPVQVCFAYKKSADTEWSYTAWVSKAADGTHAVRFSFLQLGLNTRYDFKAQLKYNDTVIEGTNLQFTTISITDGCFIATAAYGTPTAKQIDVLREFRDVVLLKSTAGSQFVALYYQFSPPIADFIAGNELLRTLVRELLVDPIVWVVEATGDIWQN